IVYAEHTPLWHQINVITIFLDKALHSHQGLFEFIIGCAVGATHVALTGDTERAAGHDGDLFLEEQLLSKLIVAQAGAGDRGEGVERATRLAAGQSDAVQASDTHATATVILLV